MYDISKTDAAGIPNLTQNYSTTSTGNPLILRSKSQSSRSQDTKTVPAWVTSLLWVLASSSLYCVNQLDVVNLLLTDCQFFPGFIFAPKWPSITKCYNATVPVSASESSNEGDSNEVILRSANGVGSSPNRVESSVSTIRCTTTDNVPTSCSMRSLAISCSEDARRPCHSRAGAMHTAKFADVIRVTDW